jgi:hypothetical protein
MFLTNMRNYKPEITTSVNIKGVLDIDSVKGCYYGIKKYPGGGCYGLCYAAKMAKIRGYDFNNSISRNINNKNSSQLRLFDSFLNMGDKNIFRTVEKHNMDWFRIGTMGDPCHNWELTCYLCEWLYRLKIPVIVTKHWIPISDKLLFKLKNKNVVFNTSISPLDTIEEIKYRLYQFNRIKKEKIKSVLRIVSCEFGKTNIGKRLSKIQSELFKNKPIIDNPLRIPCHDKRVIKGHIITSFVKDLNSKTSVSILNKNTYIGKCSLCPDQCGIN